ncbi:MAG: N-acetylglucosamine-6-phosphate deacetylase [Oscillospiraceae bacterium]|nr:N-acetylglucosamine-6-phosphate deacetylase [Lachnospiraceae bacterium]MBR3184692.1 N-acetylglucosamine-6-phosphate deacetylase [Oscillospiraceae bacterium]
MLFSDGVLFLDGRGFTPGSMRVEDGIITEILPPDAREEGCIDLGGAHVIPGLVDIHTHGNSGADFSDGDYEGLRKMAAFLARQGVTGFAPASMTLPYEVLSRAYATARRLADESPYGCARLLGINMEGPFFSEKKKGAQNAAHLRNPDFDAFRKLYEDCGGLIRIVDLAPELPGAANFAAKAAELCTVSAAHTDATYDEARAMYEAGARHLTHLYNAMPSIHHRKPGVIGAASERDDVYAELICDGQHVHESAVRMAFKLFPGRICLISDALRCCGMPDGQYELGGQDVFLSGGVARLADGTIAGSAATLFDCLHKAIAFGIDRDTAIRAATINPAKQLGCDDHFGSIAVGKRADFLVCDETLALRAVYLGGGKLD